jgi:hypothetical protein
MDGDVSVREREPEAIVFALFYSHLSPAALNSRSCSGSPGFMCLCQPSSTFESVILPDSSAIPVPPFTPNLANVSARCIDCFTTLSKQERRLQPSSAPIHEPYRAVACVIAIQTSASTRICSCPSLKRLRRRQPLSRAPGR